MIEGQLSFNIFTENRHGHGFYLNPKTGLLLICSHS